MAKSIVAIVGRPNVGKSTLFNRILRKMSAIVEDHPGVTRDRNYADALWEDKAFTLIDTGGFEPETKNRMLTLMRNQTTLAIEEADCIIFLMDGQEGLLPSDIEVANRLRESGKPILYVVNKIDGPKHEKELPEFTRLGIAKLYPVSALHGPGFYELMEGLYSLLPDGREEIAIECPKIAIIGRPNVGKSSLLNALLGKERVIVDSIPGTTRDSVDSVCSYHGKKFLFIDTAGIRKKGKISQRIERYSVMRALKAIERCDVALILLDATEGPTEQDVKIAALTHEAGKGAIVLLNKWDLIKKDESTLRDYKKLAKWKMFFIDYAPVIAVSALTKQRVTKVFDIIEKIIEERKKRIHTAKLNTVMKGITAYHSPQLYRGKEIKVYYSTQVSIEPPTFTIFVNYPEGINEQYLRYIEKGLRKTFGFEGTSIRIFVRGKERHKDEMPRLHSA